MILTIVFSILNIAFSFVANYIMKLSALEITPAAMMILAWNGNNILVNALILTIAYDIASPKDFRYIWFKLPLAILIGYMALSVSSALLLLLVYHLAIFLLSLGLGFFNARYVIFAITNFVFNYFIAKVYYLF